MKEVYKFFDSLNISDNDPLVIGVSYGPDSMFLLNLIKNKYINNKIVCAHIHHNHRNESDIEAEALRKYCIENKIIFEMMKIESYIKGKFTEEEARDRRYNFFEDILKKYNSKFLFTAHHGDDLVETILMKISRGSSINGYSGIKLISRRNNYSIIRPLLYLTKDEIINSCDNDKIPYAVDKSNLSLDYTRNRYRNNILPLLKKETKDIHRKFLDFSNNLQKYEEYINNTVENYYKTVVTNNVIDIQEILKLDDLIIEKLIEKYLLISYKADIKQLDNKHVAIILDMIYSNKSNVKVSMPNKKTLVKSYNKIYFDIENEYNSYCYIFDDFLEIPNGYIIKKIEQIENTSNFIAAFNSKDIEFPLYVRNKVNGDKIDVLNLNGSKKVKDIFIDEKLDIKKRNTYPILVDSKGKILWLPGLKKSKYDKSKKGNYDIILKYYKEEI